jgi:hypothetical protein
MSSAAHADGGEANGRNFICTAINDEGVFARDKHLAADRSTVLIKWTGCQLPSAK